MPTTYEVLALYNTGAITMQEARDMLADQPPEPRIDAGTLVALNDDGTVSEAQSGGQRIIGYAVRDSVPAGYVTVASNNLPGIVANVVYRARTLDMDKPTMAAQTAELLQRQLKEAGYLCRVQPTTVDGQYTITWIDDNQVTGTYQSLYIHYISNRPESIAYRWREHHEVPNW